MTARPLMLASDTSASPRLDTAAPRTDFVELAHLLGADISYADADRGMVKRLERALASDVRQAARAARRRDVSLYFALSEKTGLPLGLLPVRAPRVLIGHFLTSNRKRQLHRATGVLHRFDQIVVLCRAQERYLLNEAQVAPDKVKCVSCGIDQHFWTPDVSVPVEPDLVLSAGRERRDYETLVEAARELPNLRFVIVASSPWSKGTEQMGREIPANVTLRRGLDWLTLRDLYRRASLVVVPLQAGCEYAAGVNGVLEAQAMQKAVIVSRTPGIEDYIEDGVTGLWAGPGDPSALAAQIVRLCRDRDLGAQLAQTARQRFDPARTFDTYLDRLTTIVGEAARLPRNRESHAV